MSKSHRLAYVFGFTLILSPLCQLKIVTFVLGEFGSADVGKEVGASLLFGSLCGLSEQMLSSAVQPHFEMFLPAVREVRDVA